MAKKMVCALLLAAPLWLAPAALAADPQVALSASAPSVAANDTVSLEVSVSGAGTSSIAEPVIEGIDHFHLLGTSKGEQLSIVNMSVTRAITWRYSIRPKKEGETVALRAKVPVGGTNYLSNTVMVETKPAAGQAAPPSGGTVSPGPLFGLPGFPPGGQSYRKDDFILQARISPATVYEGEEAVYIVAFYQGADIFSNINFIPPAFKKLWTEQPDNGERHGTKPARIGGRAYELTEVRQLVYPLSAGTLAIPAASASFTPSPFSPAVTIKSNELTLKVKPLPKEGKPEGFSGLVGNFSITAALSAASGAAGSPAILTVTVAGTGALQAIPRPKEPAIDAERYDPETKDAFQRTARGSEGSRTFSYIVVPRKEGVLTIPPFAVDFFDPAAGKYRTAATKPLTLNVAAGQGTAPAMLPPASHAAQSKTTAPFWARESFYLPLIALLVLLAGAKIYSDRRKGMRRSAEAARSLRAEPLARERLAQAERLLQQNDTEAFLAAVENAVRGYLADRLQLPPAAITPEDIAKHQTAETQEEYRACLEVLQTCFDARYSAAAVNDPAAILTRAKAALK